MEPLVEILDVSVAAGGLDAWPDREPSFALNVGGWARDATRVEFRHDAGVLWEAPVDLERAEMGEGRPGFYATLNSLPLPREFKLEVVSDRGEVGMIRGRRAALASAAGERIRPLMLTGFSRTGSNLVLRLLGAHPEVAVYRPFQYEPRVLTYWADVFRELTEPASYLRQITSQGRIAERAWWLGAAPPAPRPLLDPAIQRDLALDTVSDAAAFCRERIAHVYGRIAPAVERAEARLFAEKQLPGCVPTIAWELYPDAREVFLVRDFRDMIASVLDWRARFGGAWFGHARAGTGEDFVRSFEGFAGALVASWRRRAGCAHLLRYEDLIAAPDRAVPALVDYLGVGRSGETLGAMAASLTERTPQSERYRTTESAPASIGRWREDLDPRLRAAAQDVFAPALAEFGYE